MLGLALAAGTLVPAASAAAGATPPPTPASRFGVRLVNVPVAEERNPRAYRYIIDYLPGVYGHPRRIMILNEESRPAHFPCTRTRADQPRLVRRRQRGHPQRAGHLDLVAHPELTLRPHTTAMDMITIRVPRAPAVSTTA